MRSGGKEVADMGIRFGVDDDCVELELCRCGWWPKIDGLDVVMWCQGQEGFGKAGGYDWRGRPTMLNMEEATRKELTIDIVGDPRTVI